MFRRSTALLVVDEEGEDCTSTDSRRNLDGLDHNGVVISDNVHPLHTIDSSSATPHHCSRSTTNTTKHPSRFLGFGVLLTLLLYGLIQIHYDYLFRRHIQRLANEEYFRRNNFTFFTHPSSQSLSWPYSSRKTSISVVPESRIIEAVNSPLSKFLYPHTSYIIESSYSTVSSSNNNRSSAINIFDPNLISTTPWANKKLYKSMLKGFLSDSLFDSYYSSSSSTNQPYFHIHIFAWRRGESLKRLLESLRGAIYFRRGLDEIKEMEATDEDIQYKRFKFSLKKPLNVTIHVDGGYSKKVALIVRKFQTEEWPFGDVVIDWKEKRVGLVKVRMER